MTARLFFVRSPRPGQVKTRLARGVAGEGGADVIPGLGDAAACELYRAFALDMLDALRGADHGAQLADPAHAQDGTRQRPQNTPHNQLHIFYHPPEDEALVRQWLGTDATYFAQTGDGLGQRMASAFAHVFGAGFRKGGGAGHGVGRGRGRTRGCGDGLVGKNDEFSSVSESDISSGLDGAKSQTCPEEKADICGRAVLSAEDTCACLDKGAAHDVRSLREYASVQRGGFGLAFPPVQTAILTGSDIPALRPHHIARAEELLRTHDAVLGPAEDGGYYLIGFRREAFCAEALTEVAFGGGNVLERTLSILREAGRTVALADTLPDVDTADELTDQLRRGLLEGTRTAELARTILAGRGRV